MASIRRGPGRRGNVRRRGRKRRRSRPREGHAAVASVLSGAERRRGRPHREELAQAQGAAHARGPRRSGGRRFADGEVGPAGGGGGRGLVICRTCDVCHQHCLFLAPSIYARRSPWQLTDLESVHWLTCSFPAHSPSTLSSALEKMSPCRFSATHWYMPASARPTAVMFSVPCSI